MSPHAGKYLRHLAREASKNQNDRTDYTRSYTASAFVPFYAQRISFSIVVYGARAILKGLKCASLSRLRARA